MATHTIPGRWPESEAPEIVAEEDRQTTTEHAKPIPYRRRVQHFSRPLPPRRAITRPIRYTRRPSELFLPSLLSARFTNPGSISSEDGDLQMQEPVRRQRRLGKRSPRFQGVDKDIVAARRASLAAIKRRSEACDLPDSVSLRSPVLAERWRRDEPTLDALLHTTAGQDMQRGQVVVRTISVKRRGRKSLIVDVRVLDLRAEPLTPGLGSSSIANTPIELYSMGFERQPKGLIRERMLGYKRRSLLLDKSGRITPLGENDHVKEGNDNADKSRYEDEVVPVATEIHLPTGDVLTVIPPEATAWQRRPYIQGQIQLNLPEVVPRRGSLATLAPFQDAMDDLYQEALPQPRQLGDDAVFDEICDFVTSFEFDEVNFEFDRFDFSEGEVPIALDDDLLALSPLVSPSKEFAHSPFFLPDNYSRADSTIQIEVHDYRSEQLETSGKTTVMALHSLPGVMKKTKGSGPTSLQRLSGGSSRAWSFGSGESSDTGTGELKSAFDDDDVEETSVLPAWLLPKKSVHRNQKSVDRPPPVPPKEKRHNSGGLIARLVRS